MTIKQFLFTNRKNSIGETNLWPPIGDLCMVVIGTLMWFLINDNTAYLGLVVMAIGVICFGVSGIKYEQQKVGSVD